MRMILKYGAFSSLVIVVGMGVIGNRSLRALQEPTEPPQRGQGSGDSQLPEGSDLICEVEGESTILKLVPEGTKVGKGDLVCELDSAGLRDELINRQITLEGAEAKLNRARSMLRTAEVRKQIEQEQRFPLEDTRVEGRFDIAKEELAYALEYLAHLQDTNAAPLTIKRARLDHRKAEFEFQNAETDLVLWREYKKPTRVRELEGNILKAQSEILGSMAKLELQRLREERLRQQIEKCTLSAPIAGIVRYPSRAGVPPIQEGGMVRERQRIVRIVPETTPEW